MGCNCGGKSMRTPSGSGTTARPSGSHAPNTAPTYRTKAVEQTVQSAGLVARRAILTQQTQHAATRRQV